MVLFLDVEVQRDQWWFVLVEWLLLLLLLLWKEIVGILFEGFHQLVGDSHPSVLGRGYDVRDVPSGAVRSACTGRCTFFYCQCSTLEFDRAQFGGTHCNPWRLVVFVFLFVFVFVILFPASQKDYRPRFGSFRGNLGRGHAKGMPAGWWRRRRRWR